MNIPALRREEMVALQLRALYEKEGYRKYRMGSFEEYDLYMQNKPFLKGNDIITFTGIDGRLMALKPDVTLSIVKNTPAGTVRRVYYTESVYRRSRQTGEYREINQMGLEFIGGNGCNSEAEVLLLAAKSLAAVGKAALDLSHMELIEAMLAPFGNSEQRQPALEALRAKSPHGMRFAAIKAGLPEETILKLEVLTAVSGDFATTLEQIRDIAKEVPGTSAPLAELENLFNILQKEKLDVKIGLDFSILNDADYYNGLIFQGYVNGTPRSILSGGRYDNLLHRFEKPQGAIGFALYLDEVGRVPDDSQPNSEKAAESNQAFIAKDDYLNVALPKGRMGNKVYAMFAKAGLSCPELLEESRKLVFEDKDNKVRYFLVKPSDVDIYVEHGAADIGVVGRDVLLESSADILDLMDLQLGKCRLSVAGHKDFKEDPARVLRVATKYPTVARRYYAAQSRSVEIINLHGSIELAPILGLSDVIVDIVETGTTLKENNLVVMADIATSTARLVANKASWRFKGLVIQTLLERLGGLL